MMTRPENSNITFSVIIPTYNRAKELDRALESLARQTFKSFEVLVCDDGSKDDTQSVVDKHAQSMTIKYLYEPNWGGPARPRNSGMKNAEGDWLCFLDSDDWWASDKLERVSNFIGDYDFIYHDCYFAEGVNERKKPYRTRSLKPPVFVDLFTRGNAIITSSACIRKVIADKVGAMSEDKVFVFLEDYDYWLRTALITEKFLHLPEALGYYWIDENCTSISSPAKIARRENVFYRYCNLLTEKDRAEAEYLMNYIVGNAKLKLGDILESKKHLLISIRSKQPIIKIKSAILLSKLYCRIVAQRIRHRDS